MMFPRYGTQAVAVGENIYPAGGGPRQGFLDTDNFDVFRANGSRPQNLQMSEVPWSISYTKRTIPQPELLTLVCQWTTTKRLKCLTRERHR